MVHTIDLALLEKLILASDRDQRDVMRDELVSLRNVAYVSDFVDPRLEMTYNYAKELYSGRNQPRPNAARGGATLH